MEVPNIDECKWTKPAHKKRKINNINTKPVYRKLKTARYASDDDLKLKRHLLKHWDKEKPYVCDICHVRFTLTKNLTVDNFTFCSNLKIVY